MFHKLNGQINALFADFGLVEKGERGISKPPQLPPVIVKILRHLGLPKLSRRR
jgi:hypothetical protein